MKVKVYSTQMGEREVNTQATTWGELQSKFAEIGIKYKGMKAVTGETKITLENDAAQIPEGDFTLFLMPKKTKSGTNIFDGMPYKELRASIKDFIEAFGKQAKDHFNKDKNYTTKGTEVLRGLLKSWKGQTTIEGKAESKAEENISEVATNVKEKKAEKIKKAKKPQESLNLQAQYEKLSRGFTDVN